DKKSPEKREFWGWWMELAQNEQEMSACYHIGRYTLAGDWVAE
ncbi:Crl family RNA polymerase assembly factor, partial [Vibrio cholerae]